MAGTPDGSGVDLSYRLRNPSHLSNFKFKWIETTQYYYFDSEVLNNFCIVTALYSN